MASITGLLVLTRPVAYIIPSLHKVLNAASKHVTGTLYVHLDPLARTKVPDISQKLQLYSSLITKIYSSCPQHCKGVDVRVLLAGFKDLSEVPTSTCAKVDIVLFDEEKRGNELHDLEKRYKSFLIDNDKAFLFDAELNGNEYTSPVDNINEAANRMYSSVVIGGTFDCIHEGHKILLSEALLRCSNRLTCGVAEGPLLKNKTLMELIQPCEKRIQNVRELASDIDPSVDYTIVPITDPCGPTRWDPNMDMIVVSEETKKGIESINKVRQENGLNLLDGYIISLIEDKQREYEEEEVKISASSMRMRLLGTIINPVTPNPSIPSTPVVVGLTGGSASGKTSVAKRLAKLGADIIDCDKLGHQAYKKGTECYTQLVDAFGSDIIGSDGEIDRRALGAKVFNNKQALNELNSLVWPQIGKLAKEKMYELSLGGSQVVVLDAAVLLEADWHTMCHQVWVCMIKREEAIRRIVERDGKTEEEAARRIDNQLSNQARVCRANIVFCTQWEPAYTQQQVERAWASLTHDPAHKAQL